MRIVVIGANGRSGRAFVSAALKNGHVVTATYHRSNVFEPQDNLTTMSVDTEQSEEVERALRNQDVVMSLLGHVKGTASDMQTRSTENIISSMHSLGLSRYVSLTGTGVRFENDYVSLIDRFMNASINIIDPGRIKDGVASAELIKNSDLEWTIVRVLKLTNSNQLTYHLSEHGPSGIFTSRKAIALALLEVINDHSYIKKAPIMS